jgi:hypothetical protein
MSRLKSDNPFRYFHSSPEVIRLVVMMYVRFPLSLRDVEDLLFERGIDLCHETVRLWWNRFGPLFAADIRRQRVNRMRGFRRPRRTPVAARGIVPAPPTSAASTCSRRRRAHSFLVSAAAVKVSLRLGHLHARFDNLWWLGRGQGRR